MVAMTSIPAISTHGAELSELKSDERAAHALLSEASCRGTVRVLVGVKAPKGGPTGRESDRDEVADDVDVRKTAVVETLIGMGTGKLSTFAGIPYLTVSADPAALQHLLSSDAVATVHDGRSPEETMPDKEKAKDGASLRAKAGRGGVRVLVTLGVPKKDDEKAIARVQEALLRTMKDRFRVDGVMALEFSPTMAMTVDSDGLEHLFSSPLVCTIHEEFPEMAQ